MGGFAPKQQETSGAFTGAQPSPGGGRAAATLPPAPSPAPWPGLDVDQGLLLWNHDVQAYQACLQGFAQRHAATAHALAHSPACEVAVLVHRLKGLAASLGLGDVASAAVAADEALHEGCLVARHVSALQVALNVALQSIGRYAAASAAAGTTIVPAAGARPLPRGPAREDGACP